MPADPAADDDGDATGGSSSTTGEVLAATGRPSITLPPTDTLLTTPPTQAGDASRLVLLGLAAILGSLLLLPTRRAPVRG